MAKLIPVDKDGEIVGYYFRCPGCMYGHVVHVNPHKNSLNANWGFNGDMEKPTFTPSIINRVKFEDVSKPDSICHIFVTDGKIQFLNDSTHALSGQTVDIPDIGD